MTDGAGQATVTAESAALVDLKRQHRAMWEAGDFARIAELGTLVAGAALVERVGVHPEMDVLDVATGTGNAALPAAAAGAHVIGLDIAPDLLEKARERAANRGLDVDWMEGDAEDLPFADGRFDRVLSTFGVQFAPRHEVAARELARACAPGALIGLANWTPDAPPMRVLALIASHLPPQELAWPPALWGTETHVRRLFAGTGVELEFDCGTVYFEQEGSTEEFVAFYETYFGPLVAARERLSGDGRWATFRAGLEELWETANVSGAAGTFRAPAKYLLIVGHKRGNSQKPH